MKTGFYLQSPAVRVLVPALLLVSGLAACGQEPAAVPAAKPGGASPEAAAREQTPAAETAKTVPVVLPGTEQRAADTALAAKVKSALVADPQINALEIDVVAADGTVTLFGTAPTRASRERATRVAADITGVKSVANKLAVVAGS